MRPDFSTRAEPAKLPEWMDEPCSYQDFRDCLVDLAQVNRLTLAYRPTLQFLSRAAQRAEPSHSLHIVDVGSGGGDMLRHIAAWANRHKVSVKLTGIDLNPHAARAAREFTPPGLDIEWITGDAYAYAPTQPVDIILSSLFTHHLASEEIVRFLRWSHRTARYGWFVNDLYRSALAYKLFRALAFTARWHRFVQHDGPVSIRRSFREQDWQRLCAAAEIPASAVAMQRYFPWRLCVGHLREQER